MQKWCMCIVWVRDMHWNRILSFQQVPWFRRFRSRQLQAAFIFCPCTLQIAVLDILPFPSQRNKLHLTNCFGFGWSMFPLLWKPCADATICSVCKDVCIWLLFEILWRGYTIERVWRNCPKNCTNRLWFSRRNYWLWQWIWMTWKDGTFSMAMRKEIVPFWQLQTHCGIAAAEMKFAVAVAKIIIIWLDVWRIQKKF